MRRFIFPGVALAAVLLSGPSYAWIDWKPCDLKAAATAAAAQGKPVMILFQTAWEPSCRALEQKITSVAAFAEAVAPYYPVRCEATSGAGEELAGKYGISVFPTLVFIDPACAEIDRVAPFLTPEAAVSDIAAIREGKQPAVEYSKKADVFIAPVKAKRKTTAEPSRSEDAENGAEPAFDAGARWAGKGDAEKAKKYLGLVLAGDQKNSKGLASKAVLLLGAGVFMRTLRDYPNAADQLEQLKKYFPDSPEAKGVNVTLATAYLKAKKEGLAVMMLRKLINDNPNEYEPYLTYAWFSWVNRYKLEDGLAMADKATGLNPGSAGAWDAMSKIQMALGKKDDAIKSAEEAAKDAPGDPYYRDTLESLKR